MHLLFLTSITLSLVACTRVPDPTGPPRLPPASALLAAVELPAGLEAATQVEHRQFPALRGPARMPAVDAIVSQLWAGDVMAARVHVCVQPNGTAWPRLLASSGDHRFDRALLESVAAWRYRPYSGLAASVRCRPLRLVYLVPPRTALPAAYRFPSSSAPSAPACSAPARQK